MNNTASTAPKFLNNHGYSDIHPYEVVRVVSEKCVEIREMDAELSADWKPNFIPGGFAGHVTNNAEQVWTFKSNPERPIIRARLGKRGWKSHLGFHRPSDQPRRFHDYNF